MDRIVVNSSTQYTVIEELNSEFSLVKIRVMASGKNRNMSYFSRENIENHLSSLSYVPVVAHLFKDDEGNYRIGGHDWYIDENWNIKSLCVPYGVVKTDSFGWETVDEYGTDVEYLTCEAILWTGRYPELKEAIYSENVWFNQSMEINCYQYRPLESDSNYMEILDYEYSALCLLYKSDNREENVEPCFISADVRPENFSADEFASQMNEMKNAMAEVFAFETKEGENMDENTNTTLDTNEDVKDFEALYNEASQRITDLESQLEAFQANVADLTAQIDALTPYKLAAEKAEREKAEAAIYAKYDEHIGDMPEYKELKEKADEYELDQLDNECMKLVGLCAMRSFALKTKTNDKESTLKFSFETNTPTKISRYGDLFERYGNTND